MTTPPDGLDSRTAPATDQALPTRVWPRLQAVSGQIIPPIAFPAQPTSVRSSSAALASLILAFTQQRPSEGIIARIGGRRWSSAQALARNLVTTVAPLYPDGIIHVAAYGAHGHSGCPSSALRRVLHALRVGLPRRYLSPQSLQQRFHDACADKRLLLVVTALNHPAALRLLAPPPGCACLVIAR